MSAFPSDTFYAPGESYYLKSGVPVSVPNPFDVKETDTNSFKTRISTTENGGGIVGKSTLALMNQSIPEVTYASVDLVTQTATGLNAIGLNVGQVGVQASLVVDNTLGVEAYMPITIYDTTTPSALKVSSSNISTQYSDISMGTPNMTITSVSNVTINSNATFDVNGNLTIDKAGVGTAALTGTDLTFSNATGTAKVGASGSLAYFGYGTAPVVSPGVSVDSNQSATLQFTDGTNKGLMQQSGSNIVIGSVSVPAAISIDPAGVVDIPNLTYPSTINTTTLNAVYGNFTSNISVVDLSATFINVTSNISALDISANFVYAPTLSCTDLNAIGSVYTSALNSNSLANLIEYAPTPNAFVNTTGAPGVWLGFFSVPISSNIAKCPSMDFHMPPIAIDPNNPPNFNWAGAIGVIGSNIGVTPLTFKNYAGVINGRDNVGGDCFVLRNGVDYNAATTDMDVYVIGIAQNPQFNVVANTSNVHIRGYPF